ncbi:hypothetical protein Lalb_Chr04g0264201 [Lupinus albus]|uniref:Uncharacterized protein n=1 Tax=Lupinus albus TaxID=3870 RepID=A0A6A4QSS5_LUPAL|nr:hypothetical protein Lalb_Chr04g0264201 [Lupinus albus]
MCLLWCMWWRRSFSLKNSYFCTFYNIFGHDLPFYYYAPPSFGVSYFHFYGTPSNTD